MILTKTKQPLVIDIKNCVRINSEKIEYVNFGRLGKVKKGAYFFAILSFELFKCIVNTISIQLLILLY